MYCINCQAYGHMATYAKCPQFPKPKKETNNSAFKNTYTNVVNSIVRPNVSYANSTQNKTNFNSHTPQQMVAGNSGNSVRSLQSQANRVSIPPPITQNQSNNPNLNIINQYIQGIIQALTALTVQINNMNFAAPSHQFKNSKNKSKEARKQQIGISSDDTKYSALVANLDAETLSYVSDIVLSPPNSDKYHTLRSGSSPNLATRRLKKLRNCLLTFSLGDEKPSHLLRKMKELSNGQLQDDFLQCLWLQRMPPHIQTVLSASSEPLDKLGIIADKVSFIGASSTICAATTVPPPSQSSSCSVQPTMDSLARQIQELSLQVAELTRERNSCHQRYSSDRRRSHFTL
ncbi:uncharacterized protein TNCV_4963941 [Trichonephila clavipes]|nr:uncharacterized protein TNCV_4963941 [Trichonephila clavipes]